MKYFVGKNFNDEISFYQEKLWMTKWGISLGYF